jgi:predicted CXXCH cytochrome family protein
MKHFKTSFISLILFPLFLAILANIAYGGVLGSKHDLAMPGTISPCMFCHAPHNTTQGPAGTSPENVPLWNLVDRGPITYQMYQSDTMDSPTPGAPSSVSLACLTCHDGSGSIGDSQHHIMTINKNSYMTDDSNCSKCHPGSRDLNLDGYSDILMDSIGSDLSNDHPISIPYPLPAEDPDFFTPESVESSGIKLFDLDKKVECSSCHNPHDTTNPPFLRKSNAGSGLCLTCHNK